MTHLLGKNTVTEPERLNDVEGLTGTGQQYFRERPTFRERGREEVRRGPW